MEAKCNPKPKKPFYWCPAYWWALRQVARARLHICKAIGNYREPQSLDDMDSLCWGHAEALPYDYGHPIWRGEDIRDAIR
jgi:hypothetical protein